MVDNQGNLPGDQLSPSIASTKHQDFSLWLRSLPLSVWQDLYRHYYNRRRLGNLGNDTAGFSEETTYPVSNHQLPLLDKISLRRSVFVLIFNLIAIEIFFDLLYFGLKVLPMYFSVNLDFQQLTAPLYFSVFILFTCLKFVLFIIVACKWVTNSYVITKEEIRYKSGVFTHNEKIFMCSYTQEVTCSQGLIGRLCNFGSVEITNPAIKEKIYLDSIPNPKKYVKIIKRNIGSTPGGDFVILQAHAEK